MKRALLLLGLGAALALSGCVAGQKPPAEYALHGCQTGAWRLSDGRIVSIMQANDTTLRWRTDEGRTGGIPVGEKSPQGTVGFTDRPDSTPIVFGDCDQGLQSFDGQAATRLKFDIIDTTFDAGDVTLAGRLVLPKGDGPVPVIVEVHGSEDYSGRAFYPLQQMAPASGIGVFVYDKRGTGASGGKYTQDFERLSSDAAAAVAEARRLGGDRIGSIGLRGSSQGGWVAPLAATRAKVDFVIAAFALAISPADENRAQTVLNVAEAGYGPQDQEKAAQLADAAGRVIASNFTEGFAELDRLKRLWRKESWYQHAKGEFTGVFTRYPSFVLRVMGPIRSRGTTWDHQPVPVLEKLDIPVLFVLAGSDRDAPPEETREILRDLQAKGRNITVAEFPDTDHGMVEFEIKPDGSRQRTRVTDGYFAIVNDFARSPDAIAQAYGRASISRPQPPSVPSSSS